MIAYRIRFRVIVSGFLLLFALTACGDKSNNIVDDKSSIMAEVEFALKMESLGKPKDESSIKFIREMSEFLENENDKRSFLQIADLLEGKNYAEVEKIFKELGGELGPSATPSEREISNEEDDQKFAELSLEAAEIYISATVDAEQDILTEISDMIRQNTVLVKKENQDKFNSLANFIENNERISAESAFNELQGKYKK
ncbi:hypothetical protein GCM10010912_67980 [Paenibacillus albidus]|uniref:Lipoprotein n=1 Tax=Paenibacillus albidus TaxID=2041023 RepID=A0A917FYA1_9BACL|nr:hypothetical protein [Paenibacillus albidus]GGG13967.1 hypothetical protein GCM10010912_67980 [Paenibacillus albidus]